MSLPLYICPYITFHASVVKLSRGQAESGLVGGKPVLRLPSYHVPDRPSRVSCNIPSISAPNQILSICYDSSAINLYKGTAAWCSDARRPVPHGIGCLRMPFRAEYTPAYCYRLVSIPRLINPYPLTALSPLVAACCACIMLRARKV